MTTATKVHIRETLTMALHPLEGLSCLPSQLSFLHVPKNCWAWDLALTVGLAQEEQTGIEERHREGWRRTDGAKGQPASAGSWLALGKALGQDFYRHTFSS